MGCDIVLQVLVIMLLDFNPRTRMGCDGLIDARFKFLISFQSTHPYGVRRLQTN